jgi:hypothetical protein
MLRKKNPNKMVVSIILAASAILAVWFLGACKKEGNLPNPKTLIYDIFGRPDKIEDSGTVLVEYDPAECVIHYNFQPRGKGKYEEELGNELAPKLKKLFERDGNIEDAFLTIFGPSTDTYGRYGWQPVLSFEFDRDIFDSIDWGSFAKQDLLEVVKNPKWYRKSEN